MMKKKVLSMFILNKSMIQFIWSDTMNENEFKEMEEKYIELFKERPWILRYLDITNDIKLKLLKQALEEKVRVYDLEEFKKYNKNS